MLRLQKTQNFASPIKKMDMEKYKNKYRIESTRLKNHDYGGDGWYFITICTQHREHYFGDIIISKNMQNFCGDITTNINTIVETQNFDGVISPNMAVETQNFASLRPTVIGKIAHQYWMDIPAHFPFVVLDEFVIMPDHIHGLFYFDKPEHQFQIHRPNQFGAQSKNLASVIRGFKAAVKKYATMNDIAFAWQPRYYDHVVHTKREFEAIRRYIQNNPKKWMENKSIKKSH
jgi:putative transposase